MPANTVLRAAVAVLVTFGAALPAPAQITDPRVPASSPLWWTLTDEISPGQLKAIHADVKAHRDRFRDALAAGLTIEGYPGEAGDVRFFVNGNVSPELFPLWDAFDAYSGNASMIEDWDRVMAAELLRFGIDPEAAARINAIALAQFEDVDAALVIVKRDSEEFWKVLDLARDKLGEHGVREKLKVHDHVGIAMAAGTELAHTKKLMNSFTSSPRAAAASPRLEELRQALDDESWGRFRRYLLARVAVGMSLKLRESDL